jgi:hypothetical protein
VRSARTRAELEGAADRSRHLRVVARWLLPLYVLLLSCVVVVQPPEWFALQRRGRATTLPEEGESCCKDGCCDVSAAEGRKDVTCSTCAASYKSKGKDAGLVRCEGVVVTGLQWYTTVIPVTTGEGLCAPLCTGSTFVHSCARDLVAVQQLSSTQVEEQLCTPQRSCVLLHCATTLQQDCRAVCTCNVLGATTSLSRREVVHRTAPTHGVEQCRYILRDKRSSCTCTTQVVSCK